MYRSTAATFLCLALAHGALISQGLTINSKREAPLNYTVQYDIGEQASIFSLFNKTACQAGVDEFESMVRQDPSRKIALPFKSSTAACTVTCALGPEQKNVKASEIPLDVFSQTSQGLLTAAFQPLQGSPRQGIASFKISEDGKEKDTKGYIAIEASDSTGGSASQRSRRLGESQLSTPKSISYLCEYRPPFLGYSDCDAAYNKFLHGDDVQGSSITLTYQRPAPAGQIQAPIKTKNGTCQFRLSLEHAIQAKAQLSLSNIESAKQLLYETCSLSRRTNLLRSSVVWSSEEDSGADIERHVMSFDLVPELRKHYLLPAVPRPLDGDLTSD